MSSTPLSAYSSCFYLLDHLALGHQAKDWKKLDGRRRGKQAYPDTKCVKERFQIVNKLQTILISTLCGWLKWINLGNSISPGAASRCSHTLSKRVLCCALLCLVSAYFRREARQPSCLTYVAVSAFCWASLSWCNTNVITAVCLFYFNRTALLIYLLLFVSSIFVRLSKLLFLMKDGVLELWGNGK